MIKRTKIIFLSIIMLVVLLSTQTSIKAVDLEEVNMPDATLKKEINRIISKQIGVQKEENAAITKNEILLIKDIHLSKEAEISDLTGLEEAKNLEYFVIESTNIGINNLNDISPLKGLTKLRNLIIDSKKTTIKDLSPLENNNSIQNITIANIVNTENLKTINTFSKLKYLSLSGNKDNQPDFNINNYSNLTNLIGIELEWLKLSNDSDFTGFVNLTQLGIHNTNLNSEMVKKFPNSNVLFSLALRDNKKLKDITPIKKYSLVTSLQIANNSIENIDFVKEMPQLSSFYLSDNKIKSLDALKNHPTIIKTLSADRNLLTDINFIKDVKLDKGKATSTFRFHENQIIDFSPIKGQLDSGRVFAADKQRIFLNDIQLGEETDLSSLKDVTGEAFPYYVKFNNMGTFQQKGANIVWDSITPEDNPNYNSVLIRDYNTNERDVSISIVLTQKVNKVSFNNYNVKYNKDEDVKGEVPKDNVIYDFDDTITLADKGSMDKKGSKFIGWNTQEDGKGKLYKAKETVKINELIKEKEKGNETKAINFYAQWEKSEDKKEPNITKAGSNAFMIVTLLLGMSTSAYAIKKYNIL